MSSHRLRRGLTALTLAALLSPLAACADDGDPIVPSAGAAEPVASASPSADSFPVTIEQSVGNVTIPSAPSRVVALDFPSADAAIALGVIPVGMAELTYLEEGGVQEWTKDALGSAAMPELFNTDNGFPFETIAKLDPDVILATNTYPLVTENWSPLNAIAPVVAHVEDAGLDDWQDGFTKIAKALGRTAEGDRLMDEVEEAVAQTKEDHPEFLGKTASFFNYVAGDGLYVISSNDDVSMRFLRDLGFAGAPSSVTALGIGAVAGAARANVSPERYPEIEADVILGTSPTPSELAELEQSELFSRVPAVERGSFLPYGIGPATALAFPSVLSLQWAFREMIPDLADAVNAGEDETDESSSPSAST